jgi:hypothetical protein
MLGWTPEVVMDGSLFESVRWFQAQRDVWARCVSVLTARRGAA